MAPAVVPEGSAPSIGPWPKPYAAPTQSPPPPNPSDSKVPLMNWKLRSRMQEPAELLSE